MFRLVTQVGKGAGGVYVLQPEESLTSRLTEAAL